MKSSTNGGNQAILNTAITESFILHELYWGHRDNDGKNKRDISSPYVSKSSNRNSNKPTRKIFMRHYLYTSLRTQDPLLDTHRNTQWTCSHPDEQSCRMYIPFGHCLTPSLGSGLWHSKKHHRFIQPQKGRQNFSMTGWITLFHISHSIL